MNHNHKCQCEHSNVKFCKHCNTVYCTDCNQEWRQGYTYQYWNGYPWYNTYQYQATQPAINWNESQPLNTTISGGAIMNQFHDGHQTICKHSS